MNDHDKIEHLDIRRTYVHNSRMGSTLWSWRELIFGLGGTGLWVTALLSLGIPGQLASLMGMNNFGVLALVLVPLPFVVSIIYAMCRTPRRSREVTYGFAELVTDSGLYISDGPGGLTRTR